ncbi:hypothetical protein BJX68DRAFT_261083 [Aspergillus pseudodeflectus]|uniref:Uncharacterized protein n=1 Tax=Aspergillus pseudodeflectus TaxID=176178 RepID=A0ABR4L9G4_9EURO
MALVWTQIPLSCWERSLGGMEEYLAIRAVQGVRTTELVLLVETTNAIIAACKERGISVTSAFYPAYIATVAHNSDLAGAQSGYTTISPFSLRPHHPSLYTTREYAAVFCYTPVQFRYRDASSFSEIDNALSKSYRTSLREHPEFVELTGPSKHMVARLVQRQEAANAPVPTYAIVSSLGIIEDNLKRPYGDAVKVPTS